MNNQKRLHRLMLLAGGMALLNMQVASAATLTNRYSFSETAIDTVAVDTVGGQNASLEGGATFDGSGFLVLSNAGPGATIPSSDPACQYLLFPADIVIDRTAVTVETWVTPQFNNVVFADWNRIWDFGNTDGTSGVGGSFFFRAGSTLYPAGGNIGPQNWYPAAAFLPDNTEDHVVWTSDPVSGRARIYLNGALLASMTGWTATPAGNGSTTNNCLARSQYGGDRALSAIFNEFRIYDGALNVLEVAASYASGADTPSTNYGTITTLELSFVSPTVVSNAVQANVTVTASALPSSYEIHDVPGVYYESADTGIATVGPEGLITTVGVGSTVITASFGGLTNSQAIVVDPPTATLVHRYSFDTDASDSVGTADGTLMSSATVSGGEVLFDGFSGTYVELPSGMLDPTNITQGSLTFDIWATVYPETLNYARLFEFGNQNLAGTEGFTYISLVPNFGLYRTALLTSVGGPGAAETDAFLDYSLAGLTNVHVTCVVNPARQFMGIYVDGTLAGWNLEYDTQLSSITNTYSWLGRSLFTTDGWLTGSINEFRIFNGEVSAQLISAAHVAGPDSVTWATPGALESVALSMKTPVLEGTSQAVPLANYVNAPNVNLAVDPNTVFSTSDPNVATISASGLVTALSPGSVDIIVTYQGLSATNTITILPNPIATLAHRYSFDETSGTTVTDSVGSSDGTLIGTAAFTGAGEALLPGGVNGACYIDFPNGIISALGGEATIEVWATALDINPWWQRIWEFGTADCGEDCTGFGAQVIFLCSYGFTPTVGIDYNTPGGYTGLRAAGPITDTLEHHYVFTLSQNAGTSRLYVDGALAQSQPQAVSLATLGDVNVWLGRSEWTADVSFHGSYNEFRLYNGALSAAEVAASYASGPTQPLTTSLATMSAAAAGSDVTFSWPASTVLYLLESSPSVGSDAVWTIVPVNPVVAGGQYQATVPVSSSAQYFRLAR